MGNKVKILHMTPPDVKNGVYKYIFDHMQYLDHNKFEFGFLTRAAEELRQSEAYHRFAFRIHPFSTTQRDDPKGLETEVRNVLMQYDMIHLHTSSWRGFMIEEIAMKLGMERVIVHSHSTGIDVLDESERKKQMQEHFAYRERFSEKYATDFWACSHEAGEWLFGDSVTKEKILYLPNAIDTEKFAFVKNKRDAIRRELNIENCFVIGNVGRYTYQKNQEFLIRCVSKLKEKYPEIILICAGQGEQKNNYEKLIDELHLQKNVKLINWITNVEDYLLAFDIFCLPSRFEGFPISVIEAQASGLPCIIASSITSDVKLTSLIEYCDLKQDIWIKKIEDYMKCPYMIEDRYGFHKKIADKGYDIKQSARMLENLYDK